MDDERLAKKTDAMVRVKHKHPLAVRWMHWLNFPLLALMIYSGLQIYWADSVPAGQGSVHPSEVYRVGVGHWTLFRFFPEWFYAKLGLQFGLAQGLSFHFFVMWFFALNGLLYAAYLAWSGEWRTLVPRRESWRAAWAVVLHDLHLRRDATVNDKYNGAQRISYTAIVLMGAASLLTGLPIYKPVQLGWLTRAMGGYEMARWLHFWLTIGFVLFFVVHVVQVAIAGWENFQSMVTGVEVVREDAKSEAER